jgi:hypothetical protein
VAGYGSWGQRDVSSCYKLSCPLDAPFVGAHLQHDDILTGLYGIAIKVGFWFSKYLMPMFMVLCSCFVLALCSSGKSVTYTYVMLLLSSMLWTSNKPIVFTLHLTRALMNMDSILGAANFAWIGGSCGLSPAAVCSLMWITPFFKVFGNLGTMRGLWVPQSNHGAQPTSEDCIWTGVVSWL